MSHQQLILRVPECIAIQIRTTLDSIDKEQTIHIKPETGKQNYYQFILDDNTYPALLQNLPCLVESHKTVDMKIFYKAGDIGQILVVYLNEKSRDLAIFEQKILDDVEYIPHGLTIPTMNIIKKKYSRTREKQMYSFDKIQTVLDQIKIFEIKEKVHKEIIEEVVDFEEWMLDKNQIDGIKIKLEGDKWLNQNNGILLEHPSILSYTSIMEDERKVKEKSQIKSSDYDRNQKESVSVNVQVVEDVITSVNAGDEVMDMEAYDQNEAEIDEEVDEGNGEEDEGNVDMDKGDGNEQVMEEGDGEMLVEDEGVGVLGNGGANQEDDASSDDDDTAWLDEINRR